LTDGMGVGSTRPPAGVAAGAMVAAVVVPPRVLVLRPVTLELEPDGPDYPAMVRRWLAEEDYLRAQLKADGVHVLSGHPARCLVCQDLCPHLAPKPRRRKARR
jgi:hypothetical protein